MRDHQVLTAARSSDREDTRVYEATVRPPFHTKTFGTLPLASFDTANARATPPVTVMMLCNAVVQVQNNAILVRDSNGNIQADMCLHDFPAMLGRHFDAHLKAEPIDLGTAVVIGDRFSGSANLCHFMLDGLTRLAIYDEAGAQVRGSTVIAGDVNQEFQSSSLEMCGISRFVSTARAATYRVAQLWVSDSCKELQHPAHNGSS